MIRPPLRLVVPMLVVLGACGGETPSAPDAGPDALADALPPPSEQPPQDTPQASPDGPDGAPSWCPLPGLVCGGGCVDPARDPMHCGGCNQVCGAGLACSAGVCAAPPPDAGAPDAAEQVDASADAGPTCESMTPGNCCGVRCPATGEHALASTCSAGRCGFVCESSFADCDVAVANGCEVDIARSFANCGACGNACPSGPDGSGAVCRGGRCALQCPVRTGDCNGDPADGCETNVDTNPRACGACGNTCSAPTALCSDGRCGASCAAGYARCPDGCANLQFDALNCGMCGVRCAAGQRCADRRCL